MAEYYTKDQVDAQAVVVGARVKSVTAALTVKTNLESLPDTNFMTSAEKSKLAGLESSKYFGTYPDLASIPTVGASAGMYAHIDAGVGLDVELANFDESDNEWVKGGLVATETASSVKVKYESNADTNAFTNVHKTKLDGLVEATNIISFTAALDAALA